MRTCANKKDSFLLYHRVMLLCCERPRFAAAIHGVILFSQPEARDDRLVALDVLAANILQQRRAIANHFEQTTAGRVVFLVRFEVPGQVVDPSGQNRDLDLR